MCFLTFFYFVCYWYFYNTFLSCFSGRCTSLTLAYCPPPSPPFPPPNTPVPSHKPKRVNNEHTRIQVWNKWRKLSDLNPPPSLHVFFCFISTFTLCLIFCFVCLDGEDKVWISAGQGGDQRNHTDQNIQRFKTFN